MNYPRYFPDGEHVMNSDESKALRRIMSETGMNEEEVRKHKKYRKMLSDAQKQGQQQKRSKEEKTRLRVLRDVCKQYNISSTHPDFRKLYLEEFLKRREDEFNYYAFLIKYNCSPYPIPKKSK